MRAGTWIPLVYFAFALGVFPTFLRWQVKDFRRDGELDNVEAYGAIFFALIGAVLWAPVGVAWALHHLVFKHLIARIK